MDNNKCPFCGEPAIRQNICGSITLFRCGTEGPFETKNDDEGNYRTGRVCDIHTYQRLLKIKDAEIKLLKQERDILKPSNFRLNVDNPLFDGLCGGVDIQILYNTIRHLKQERDAARETIETLQEKIQAGPPLCQECDVMREQRDAAREEAKNLCSWLRSLMGHQFPLEYRKRRSWPIEEEDGDELV